VVVDYDPGQPAVDQAGEPLLALAERQRSVIDTSRSSEGGLADRPLCAGFSWTTVQVGAIIAF
jgi:hypothetical protein